MIFRKRDEGKKERLLLDHNSIRVMVAGCLVIAMALLIMSITSVMIMNKATVDKLKRYDLRMQAENIGIVIESKIDKAVDASLLMAHDPLLEHWLADGDVHNFESDYITLHMQYLANEIGYDTVFLANAKTLHYWNYHEKKFSLLDTLSPTEPMDQWFFSFLQRQNNYEINIDYNKNLKDTFVWINAAVTQDGQILGATGVGMNLGKVINELIAANAENNEQSDIWLVDGAGRICLSKNPVYLEGSVQQYLPAAMAADIEAAAADNPFFVREYKDEESQLYDIAYKRIKDSDWKLVIRMPRAESVKFLTDIKWHMALSCLAILVCMILTFYFVSHQIANPYKRALQLNKELENAVAARTSELQEKNIEIQDSLEYAQLIQQAIMPSSDELTQYLKESFVIFEPKESVGGDFYWMRGYEDGVLLAVGDCTGHGVPGALMTTAVSAMFNHIAEDVCHDDPARVLNELAREFRQAFASDSEKFIADGFETVVLFVRKNQQILFAGASMSLYQYDGSQVLEIKGNKMPVDCRTIKSDRIFDGQIIASHPDDMFYIVTDGYREQPGGERGLPYGKRRLFALLDKVANLPINEQRQQIVNGLHEYASQEKQRDDVTVLGFRMQA